MAEALRHLGDDSSWASRGTSSTPSTPASVLKERFFLNPKEEDADPYESSHSPR